MNARCGKGEPGKGCGRPTLIGMTVDGVRVPLDPKAPVYKVLGVDGDGMLRIRKVGTIDVGAATAKVIPQFLVAHYVGCPKSSGAKK